MDDYSVGNKWYERGWFMTLVALSCPPVALLVIAFSKQKLNPFYKVASTIILIVFIGWLTYMLLSK